MTPTRIGKLRNSLYIKLLLYFTVIIFHITSHLACVADTLHRLYISTVSSFDNAWAGCNAGYITPGIELFICQTCDKHCHSRIDLDSHKPKCLTTYCANICCEHQISSGNLSHGSAFDRRNSIV